MNERVRLPSEGRYWRDVERELQDREAEHAEVRPGFADRYWPSYRSDVYLGSLQAWARFGYANAFSLPRLPGLARLERELREMVADVMHVPEGGAVTLTSGGTESNFLMLKAALAVGRQRDVAEPNAVIPITAHPSFDKAGFDLGIDVRRIPVTREHRADPSAMGDAIDHGTIAVVASAPCFPQGVVDPVAQVAEIAADRGIWMHVDACVGGFLVPFLIELGEPLSEFRFDVPGVWSVSADLHKFGYTLNGMSSLSVRGQALQELHTYRHPEPGWNYRPYMRVGFTGSRPGGAIAAAWTTLQLLGHDGYLANADAIRKSARRIETCVADTPRLEMMAPLEAGIAAILVEDPLEPDSIAAGMSQRGWDLSTGMTPPTLHFLMDPHPEELTERFLADLGEVVELAAAGSTFGTSVTSYGD
jgi:glutamate/tyrosine decarboxylase-like PLP-dependent enzyme